ncbi:hypothetical protein FQZ97_892440 [compost metagenome]
MGGLGLGPGYGLEALPHIGQQVVVGAAHTGFVAPEVLQQVSRALGDIDLAQPGDAVVVAQQDVEQGRRWRIADHQQGAAHRPQPVLGTGAPVGQGVGHQLVPALERYPDDPERIRSTAHPWHILEQRLDLPDRCGGRQVVQGQAPRPLVFAKAGDQLARAATGADQHDMAGLGQPRQYLPAQAIRRFRRLAGQPVQAARTHFRLGPGQSGEHQCRYEQAPPP